MTRDVNRVVGWSIFELSLFPVSLQTRTMKISSYGICSVGLAACKGRNNTSIRNCRWNRLYKLDLKRAIFSQVNGCGLEVDKLVVFDWCAIFHDVH